MHAKYKWTHQIGVYRTTPRISIATNRIIADLWLSYQKKENNLKYVRATAFQFFSKLHQVYHL